MVKRASLSVTSKMLYCRLKFVLLVGGFGQLGSKQVGEGIRAQCYNNLLQGTWYKLETRPSR